MTDQRMKWDAKAAFKRIDEQIANDEPSERAAADRNEMAGLSYTPPSNIGPERLAQLRKYEPPAKPKGRDYDAILRAAKKPPVGYYEDAPTGIKFGKPPVKPVVRCIPRKPTPPQSADGGKPLLSAGSKPHSKDVDTADGPWPKYVIGEDGACIIESAHSAVAYYSSGTVTRVSSQYIIEQWVGVTREQPSVYRFANHVDFAQWLGQNGHKDAAAQLRGKPRDDVATGGGRVWRSTRNAYMWTRIGTTWYSYSAVRGAWDLYGVDYLRDDDMCGVWQELFGPERDAIVAECRKAMGI